MAANLIKIDRTKYLSSKVIGAMERIRDGVLLLEEVRSIILQARDGDGSLASMYDLYTAECGFQAGDYASADAAAKASFDELDSLYSKVATDNSVSNVRAAIFQACAKHGS